MTSELKPCPKCLSDRVTCWNVTGGNQIVCKDCGLRNKPDPDESIVRNDWNTRAVPDVPELVRHRAANFKEMALTGVVADPSGEYILYSQAAAVIAGIREEWTKAHDADQKAFLAAIKRAEAAESKLAQMEKQEAVGYAVYDKWGFRNFHTQKPNVSPEELNEYEIIISPLYAAPIPAPDLKAEIERLREALKPFAEYMRTEDGRLDLDNKGNELPCEHGVGWVYLNHGHFRTARAALNSDKQATTNENS